MKWMDATLFHYERSDEPGPIGSHGIGQAQAWSDSMWASVSTGQPR